MVWLIRKSKFKSASHTKRKLTDLKISIDTNSLFEFKCFWSTEISVFLKNNCHVFDLFIVNM